MVESRITCPVCNTEKTGEGTVCSKCGFAGAYCTLFGSERAYQLWKSLVDEHRNEFLEDSYTHKREQGSELLVTSDRVCFF